MSQNPIEIWERVLSGLQKEISSASLETWFSKTRPLKLEDQSLVVAVPDSFTKGGIARRYQPLVEKLASEACSQEVHLHLQVVQGEKSEGDPPVLSRTERPRGQLNSTLPLNPDYTFDWFVRGKNNHLAYAASMAVAEAPGKAYNPLFIYGSVGLGKTHLLQAIGNFIIASDRSKTVGYTTSERFAIELITAIRNNTTAAFREKYRLLDLLLIDDVQFLEGKEATQEELFHTFNELYGSEKQIVLSSDRSPKNLSGLQDRLVSRFRWGLVADIQPPDFETRIAILREKASHRGITVDDNILELIARRISSNVRALEGALVKAIAHAELEGEDLTPENLEGMLPEEGKREKLTIVHIKEEIADLYHLKRHDLEGSSRKKEIAQARHLAIYLAREMTNSSFPAIGKHFGNRDHTTIMHSCMKVKELIKEAPLLHAELKEIQESLAARFTTTV
ncbi:MAG: chromosomal replication initiator protein DnaA [Candidatus Bipolaricaulota bacterium]|nr:chromosomal replication initiator protein DnaA [Candidatus Bipolaricaulota bacterium]